jgi:hypothetical protein
MKQNYKLLLSYDGSRYFGFERQNDQELTIQGKLEAVLSAMPRNDTEKVETFSAGRTDAGVHARGMCCNVFLDTNLTEEEIQEYCNHYLPEDIGINSVKKASERFHARYLARGKVYRYSCYIGKNKDVFERKYLYHLEEEPDIEEMKRAGAYLVGEKDFKSFSGNPKMKKSTVRKIFNIDILRNGNILRFYFHGSGFLQYQIRIMVGTLLEVGYHKKRAEEMEEILLSRDRRRAGYTAPAKGLCLMKVEYD